MDGCGALMRRRVACGRMCIPGPYGGGGNGNLLGGFGGVGTDGDCFLLAGMSVRILSIKEGEEAIIRVNSRNPIMLEFPGHLVTVYEDGGKIFHKVEKQSETMEETQEMDEEGADSDGETQCMETQVQTQMESDWELDGIPVEYDVLNKGIAEPLFRASELQDIQDTEIELFGN